MSRQNRTLMKELCETCIYRDDCIYKISKNGTNILQCEMFSDEDFTSPKFRKESMSHNGNRNNINQNSNSIDLCSTCDNAATCKYKVEGHFVFQCEEYL